MRLSVVNLKGGTGKTVTAVHLATGLARLGRTLLVDADPQGSALSWSEEAADLPCSVVSLPVRDLPRRLPSLLQGMDHAVIDTPPGDRVIVRGAVAASEIAIVPMPTSIMDLDRLRPTLDLIEEVEALTPVRVFVLLTRVRTATKSAHVTREVLEELGIALLDNQIPLRENLNASFGTVPGDDGPYTAVLDELQAREVAA